MEPAASTPTTPSCSGLARLALGLSVFSFLPPLGIAAIVCGHLAERRIESSNGALNGKSQARAALWIAYLQLAMISIAFVVLGNLFHVTAQGFRRDAMVQRVLRATDQNQPLDPESAREAEITAMQLTSELVAMQQEFQRQSEDGLYACDVNRVLATGLKGASDTENRALAARVAQSPYLFTISECNLTVDGFHKPTYFLAAVPRIPRLPADSRVFCADESGTVLEVRGGTSADCMKSGEPAR